MLEVADKDLDDAIKKVVKPKKKLTEWKLEPTVEQLRNDYTAAKPAHDTHVQEVTTWLDNLHIQGSAKIQQRDNYSNIQPKVIRKNNEWRYSSLSEPFLSTDDLFNTAPATSEDRNSAIQNGLVLNHQFNNQLDKQAIIDETVRVFVDEGTVVIRTGWEYEETLVTETVPTYEYTPTSMPEQFQLMQQAAQLEATDKGQFELLPDVVIASYYKYKATGSLVIATEIGSEEVEVVKVIKDQPTVTVCDYHNVMIDPNAEGDVEKAKFVIYSFKTSYAEMKAQPDIYQNIEAVDYEGNAVDGDGDFHEGTSRDEDTSSFNYEDKARKQVIAREYWGYRDVEGNGELQAFVATYIGDVMVRMQENPYPDRKIPFVVIPYMPIKGDNYGEPDGELLIDNQKIIGATTRGMIDVMARGAAGQQGIRKGALDAANLAKFKRGEDYEFNGNVDATSLVYMHKFDELPQSGPLMLSMQQQDSESLTGVKAYASTGLTGNALGDTVGGAKSVLDAASKREMGILRRLASGFIKVAKKITAMNGEFLDEDQVVRITNDEFVKIRKDDLVGNFDVKMSISTPEADDAKASELSFMLQTLGNNVDFSITQQLLVEIARLRKMPDLARRIEQYQPQPDPLEVQKQQLEIQLLQAQLQNEINKGHNEGAKVSETMAKTEKLIAEADQIELETVETESGVTQERNKEIAKEQSKGNIELKMVEKLLENNDDNPARNKSDK